MNSLVGGSVDHTSSTQHTARSSVLYSLHDDFITRNAFNMIVEIPEIHEVRSVVVVGTIKHVCIDTPWYYSGCQRCSRKLQTNYVLNDRPDGSGKVIGEKVLECTNVGCKDKEIIATPRFRIHIRVQDCTGVVSLTLFDRDATRILKQTAKELLQKYEEVGDMDGYPDALNILMEKKYAFKIDVTQYNLDRNVQVYGISKLTDDPTIIADLEKKFMVDQPMESNSVNITMSNIHSHDTVNLKDVDSCIGDNATPISRVDKSTGRNETSGEGMQTTGDTRAGLKRNLEQVYDVDENASMSTTKPARSELGESSTNKKPLLIPKIEK